LFGKGKEIEKTEGREEIPDTLVAVIAERFFKNYAEEFANYINQRISEKLIDFEKRLNEVERKVQNVEATSGDNIKKMIKSIIEVQFESLSDMSAERTLKKLGIEKVNLIDNEIKELKKTQIGLAKNIETLVNLVKAHENSLNTHNRKISEMHREIEGAKDSLFKVLQTFEEEVSSVATSASKAVKEAITLDRNVLESALGEVVTRVVNSKMKSIVDEFNSITEKYEEIAGNIGRIIEVAESVELISQRLEELERAVSDLDKKIEAIGTSTQSAEAHPGKEWSEEEEDEIKKQLYNVINSEKKEQNLQEEE